MKAGRWNILWGVLMVIAGGLLLTEALDIFAVGDRVWPVLFGAAGAVFLYAFFADRNNWWAAIPAGALLGLTALIAWGEFGPPGAEDLGASLFLGALGAGFWAVYLRGRGRWWAIIPGGALLAISLLVGLSPVLGDTAALAVFFLGLALTFSLLAAAPTGEGRMRWSLIPASVLGLLAALFWLGAVEVLGVLNYAWPVALVAGGLYLIMRAFWSGGRPRPHG